MCFRDAWNPTFVVEAFRNGADGVIISGCHPGDCHYNEGNYKALRRVHPAQTAVGRFRDRPATAEAHLGVPPVRATAGQR